MHPLCPHRRGGYALLLALALLAFAALLVVSLTTLTQVETAVVANGRRAAQAQQHARQALNLAVGRLQRFAGPDRRVTAHAEITADGAAQPCWTGVWDAAAASGGPLTWLVSGNETNPLAVTPASAPVPDPAPDNDSVWLLRGPVSAPALRVKLSARAIRASVPRPPRAAGPPPPPPPGAGGRGGGEGGIDDSKS